MEAAEIPGPSGPSVAGRRWSTARLPTGPWAAAGAAACGCVVVALVDPTKHMVSPPCPFRSLTGWWCPFCGATRAASKLIRGDLPSALRYNLMFVLLLPLAGAFWTAWAFPERFRWLDPLRRRAKPIITVIAVVLAAFVVVRNTGLGESWLRYPNA